jgi:hypothetical protein
MTLRVLNDLHLGAERSAGTTVASRWQLRQSLLQGFAQLLPDSDLMILGDLFDSHIVSVYDVLKTYKTLHAWLRRGHKLYLVAGNHDLSKTSNVLSSFAFLCNLLQHIFPEQVVVILQPTMTEYGYVIPHLDNQLLFDAAMAAVPECPTLFLHVNYDNHFATSSDNSLNLSPEQAANCPARSIVIGHEHSARVVGKVVLPGNQLASSVSDWLGRDTKYYYEDGELQVCARKADFLEELDWRSLDNCTKNFVRIVGTATAAEASMVVAAIAKLRASSEAFVITNAVNIEALEGLDSTTSLAELQGFDVWQALQETMSDTDMAILNSLDMTGT